MSQGIQIRGWLECESKNKSALASALNEIQSRPSSFASHDGFTINIKAWSFAEGRQIFSEYLFFAAEPPYRLIESFDKQLDYLLSLSLGLCGFFYLQPEEGEGTYWYQISHDILSKEVKGLLYDNFDRS